MNAQVRAAGIPNACSDGVVLGVILSLQTNEGTDAVAVALRSDGADEQPVVGTGLNISQDAQRAIELPENHINAAIVVQIVVTL